VPLDLVGEDTFNSVALECFGDLLNDFGHRVVSGSLCDFTLGSLEGVPCGEDRVSLAARDGTGSDNDGGGGVGSETINVRAANTKVSKRLTFCLKGHVSVNAITGT